MKFSLDTSRLFIPDNIHEIKALERTTHLGVVAHQDDLEIIAFHGILECFQQKDKWFTGVTVTNGSGSARAGIYKDFTDDEMREIRQNEQEKAAIIGEYTGHVFLDYPSSAIKDSKNKSPIDDIEAILKIAKPKIVYTHNPADKHETHVAVALRTIEAVRRMPSDARPKRFLGCEAWRDLDWLPDADKVVLDVSAHENLQAALLGVFDSQIAGGKRYDLATMGRRRAHATYLESHATDISTGIIFAMDLTPLITDTKKDVCEFVKSYIDRFTNEVFSTFKKLRS